MTIYQGLTTSFKVDILEGKQNIASDTLYMALYTAYATLNQDTAAYTSDNEISGTGYTAGGQALSNVTIQNDSNTVFVSFSDVTWTTATITAAGALIYNSSKNNKAVAVFSFGASYSSTAGNFTLSFPANTSSTAVIILN